MRWWRTKAREITTTAAAVAVAAVLTTDERLYTLTHKWFWFVCDNRRVGEPLARFSLFLDSLLYICCVCCSIMFAIIACCSIICIKWNCFTRRHISLCLRYFSAVFLLHIFCVCLFGCWFFFSYTPRFVMEVVLEFEIQTTPDQTWILCLYEITLQANDLIMVQTQTEWCKKQTKT